MATKTATKATAADVRAWANSQSDEALHVGVRGRIPADVIRAFNKGKKGNKRFIPADQTL